MKFPILNIDDISTEEEIKKLKEEIYEFMSAFLLDDEENMLEEFMDIIQVCVNLLDRYDLADDLEEALSIHIRKLKSRGWKFKRFIEL